MTLNSQKSSQYEEVFIAVIGTTPQVLTECLFYCTHPHYQKQRYFSKIKVLTSLDGKVELIQSLFIEGQLEKLEKALDLKQGYFKFREQDIIVFKDETGQELTDLLSNTDNQQAQLQIMEAVKKYTEDPKIRLTANVSGGRKTQSAMMALAFQLYGRAEDELFHIIPPKDKTNTDWFFPSQAEEADEQLMISQVPVIRVGRYLAKDLSVSVEDLMQGIQESLVELLPIRSLLIEKSSFTIDEKLKFTLQPREAALFRYLLRQRKQSGCKEACPGCDKCNFSNLDLFEAFGRGILPELSIINGKMNPKTEKTAERWQELVDNRLKYDEESLAKKKSDLISEIKSRLSAEIMGLDIPLSRKEELLPINSKSRPVFVHVGLGCDVILFSD